jgi:hypothetical protein
MVTDVQVSSSISKQFEEHRRTENDEIGRKDYRFVLTTVDFHAMVLSSGSWPFPSSSSFLSSVPLAVISILQ